MLAYATYWRPGYMKVNPKKAKNPKNPKNPKNVLDFWVVSKTLTYWSETFFKILKISWKSLILLKLLGPGLQL